jgi:hypothetical protein
MACQCPVSFSFETPQPARAVRPALDRWGERGDHTVRRLGVPDCVRSPFGRLAQLARARARHARGHRFKSCIAQSTRGLWVAVVDQLTRRRRGDPGAAPDETSGGRANPTYGALHPHFAARDGSPGVNGAPWVAMADPTAGAHCSGLPCHVIGRFEGSMRGLAGLLPESQRRLRCLLTAASDDGTSGGLRHS